MPSPASPSARAAAWARLPPCRKAGQDGRKSPPAPSGGRFRKLFASLQSVVVTVGTSAPLGEGHGPKEMFFSRRPQQVQREARHTGRQERAGLLSAIYVVSYLANSAPAVADGAAGKTGLIPTAIGYTGAVMALALFVLTGLFIRSRTAARPNPPAHTPAPIHH